LAATFEPPSAERQHRTPNDERTPDAGSEETMSDLFPVFLKLRGRRVLLVGGGTVATGKLRPLIDAGAIVTVVSPQISDAIRSAGVVLRERAFEPSDLDEVWFVVAAATREVNGQVARAADARRIFVNAVDDVENASAYLGAIVRRAGVTLAISTDGQAPALAGLIREALEVVLPNELDAWMNCARDARTRWLADGVPMEQRRPLLLDALVELYDSRLAGSRR
jgi:uroporphyrin-III C-methyltransferase / precorrin-2 dehydrogenase / sirohydrochlorin ferrochelatase